MAFYFCDGGTFTDEHETKQISFDDKGDFGVSPII